MHPAAVGAAHDAVVDRDPSIGALRESVAGEMVLAGDLVHAERRGEDTSTDVRHPGEFEQTLHRAVLTHRSVQDGQNDGGGGPGVGERR